MKVTVKKLPKSEIEIEGELESELFEKYFKQALKNLGKNLKLDGFRKGKIPESILCSNIPEINILEEMANLALTEHYPKIIEDEKIDPISKPEISITKLARKNPLGFKIKTAILPEIKLPNYREIAKNILSEITDTEKNITVSEEDLENTIIDIRKSRAPKKNLKDIKNNISDNSSDQTEFELPEFNDEFVRTIGPFENTEDFKRKLKENIKLEKENAQKENTRLKIVEKIIENSLIDLPDILVEMELDKILYKMESDIGAMGLNFEEYLKQINKTKENLREEFKVEGKKRSKLALILNEIAKTEKIIIDEKILEEEVLRTLERYKNADPERVKMHIENILTNEKIFQLLENIN